MGDFTDSANMAFDTTNDDPYDALELERIAVGPYCVFDDFKPELSPESQAVGNLDTSDGNKTMEDPLGGEYPFHPGVRNQWLGTSAEDLAIAPQPTDAFPQGSSWDDFMRWDGTINPISAQGPFCQAKSEPSVYNQRQDNQLESASPVVPNSAGGAQSNNTAFIFGETSEPPSTFQFNNALSSSPKTEGPNTFFDNNPVWDNAPPYESGESSVFSPVSGEHPPRNLTIPSTSTPSIQHSPDSPHLRTSGSSTHSSPEPASSKKRKISSEDDELGESKGPSKQMPVKKTAHNMIEKRYRNNLNDKIAALRDSVPSLRSVSRGHNGDLDDDGEDLEGLTPAHKLNKATVLSKATEYIRHLEKRNKQLQNQVKALTARLQEFDKLAMPGPLAMANAVTTPDGIRFQDNPFGTGPPASSQAPPQGMIPVPESMANLHRGIQNQQVFAAQQQAGYQVYASHPALQAQQQQQQQQPMVNGRRHNAIMNKLMVGSLAGLMLLEGLSEREDADDKPASRGLFALPLNIASILSKPMTIPTSTSTISLFPLLKVFLVFSAVIYIIMPLLDSKPKTKRKSARPIGLTPAPSLASPVEVRRKAWLTAIQTVWVPQHSFVLEATALALKTLKLSIRKLVGWRGYVLLTGTTKDEEAARIKAWDIALDAQLTGGDAEISVSRLVLTLIASGTLPDSPGRLMLKALHIRVLLWEVANSGYGAWYMFEELSAKLARRYWNAARLELKKVESSPKDAAASEKLPAHLVALLDQECDEVLMKDIIQRAYNLAWNKPSAENTLTGTTMDSVVEDVAISSPLDALAAWWSAFALSRSLAGSLASDGLDLEESVKNDLDLATCTAPPTSTAHVRALAAKALLLNEDREADIATVLQSLPSPSQPTTTIESIQTPIESSHNLTVAGDIRNTLTMAKCLSLGKPSDQDVESDARAAATFVINNLNPRESELTLLSFVAMYRLMISFLADKKLLAETQPGLEKVSSCLRTWMGKEAGRKTGLPSAVRSKVVQKCVSVSKMLVGIKDSEDEGDAGYVSQSDEDLKLKH